MSPMSPILANTWPSRNLRLPIGRLSYRDQFVAAYVRSILRSISGALIEKPLSPKRPGGLVFWFWHCTL